MCPNLYMAVLRIVSITILTIVLLALLYNNQQPQNRRIEMFAQSPNEEYDANQEYTNFDIFFLSKLAFEKNAMLSPFFSGITRIDGVARNLPPFDRVDLLREYYISKYLASYIPLTKNEKDRIVNIIKAINTILVKMEFKSFKNLPWKIVKIDLNIENGYPHTIGDMIVISDALLTRNDEDILKILLHEKVHVYQRANPIVFGNLVSELGFKQVETSEWNSVDKRIKTLIRSNPDLDSAYYVHTPTNKILLQLYNSDRPNSLADSTTKMINPQDANCWSKDTGYEWTCQVATNELLGLPPKIPCQLEHPYEIVACIIAELVVNPSTFKKNKKNDFFVSIVRWMIKNFS